jgi:hypothetical protein
LLAVCRNTHVEAGRFRLPAADVLLFVRPSVQVEGLSGGWITSDGLTLTGAAADLKAFPRLELRGPFYPQHMAVAPAVRATLTASGRKPLQVPACLTVSDHEYLLVVTLSPEELPDSTDVCVRLEFDSWFVPSERPDLFGDSSDDRRLVLLAPKEVTLRLDPDADEQKAKSWEGTGR